MFSDTTKVAWKALMNHSSPTLPITPRQIARSKGIYIYQYKDYVKATGVDTVDLVSRYGADGFSQYVRGEKVIFFNPCKQPARVRWTLSHEIAHIVLNHINESTPSLPRSRGKKDFYDMQADNFAARFLCPDVVVHLCGVLSAEELQKLTDLSYQAANYHWRDLCERRMRNDFFKDDIETQLAQHFREFISSYIAGKANDEPDISPPLLKRVSCRL